MKNKMKIAFDLDDTLIPMSVTFKCGVDKSGHPDGSIALESLRKGAKELLIEISNKHELWIYTSSYRTPQNVRM
jgi:hypothetical protein